MKTLSLGKFHGLQRCSSEVGALVILAVDHRNSLRTLLKSGGADPISDNLLTSFKEVVVKTLGNEVDSILLDPQYGAGHLIARSCLPKGKGLIIALETSGYSGSNDNRVSRLLADWSVAKAARLGADAVRLLVYYHPEADSAPSIESLIDSVAQECQMMDLPLFLAGLTYSVDSDTPLSSNQRRETILETARILTAIQGVDVYMSEFPAEVNKDSDPLEWESACAALSHASRVPWLLISSAADFDVFLRMVEVACRQGASGAAAGRAAWQDAVALRGEKQRACLHKTCRSRLSQLAMTCDSAAIPWMEFYRAPELPSDWYSNYPGISSNG
ncbi:MAG: tagatose 1,6-diphosphate aldolase [Anaerolineaceae bacterium]